MGLDRITDHTAGRAFGGAGRACSAGARHPNHPFLPSERGPAVERPGYESSVVVQAPGACTGAGRFVVYGIAAPGRAKSGLARRVAAC